MNKDFISLIIIYILSLIISSVGFYHLKSILLFNHSLQIILFNKTTIHGLARIGFLKLRI